MPKVKTHKGLAKRVKITAKGKVKRHKAFGSHLMSHMSGNKCRSLSKTTIISGVSSKRTKAALGM